MTTDDKKLEEAKYWLKNHDSLLLSLLTAFNLTIKNLESSKNLGDIKEIVYFEKEVNKLDYQIRKVFILELLAAQDLVSRAEAKCKHNEN
jgi:hypothetical protein